MAQSDIKAVIVKSGHVLVASGHVLKSSTASVAKSTKRFWVKEAA